MTRPPRWRVPWALVAVIAIFCSPGVASGPETIDSSALPNFHQVDTGLWRGGQPGPAAIDDLAAMGIRSIINLRTDDEEVAAERRRAAAAGLAFHHVEMRPFGRPGDDQIRRVLDLISAAGNRPVFIHCSRGADRTGTVIACRRILREGWTPDEALAEAKSLGLGWWQFGMKRYIKDGCGMGKP